MRNLASWSNSKLMQAFGCPAALVVGLSWSAAALAEVTVTPIARGYNVDVTGQASTTELLEAIAGVTGVEIKGTPGDAAVGENHLRGASLERTIRALLPKAGFIIRSDAEGKPLAIIFMPASDESSPPPGIDMAAPPLPDGSAPPEPADGTSDGAATDVPQADMPLPDGTDPAAPLPDGTTPDTPLPDGTVEPPQDPLPSGTQGGDSGG